MRKILFFSLPIFSLSILIFFAFNTGKAGAIATCSTLTVNGAMNPQGKGNTEVYFNYSDPSDAEAVGGVTVGAANIFRVSSSGGKGELVKSDNYIRTLPANNGVAARQTLNERLTPGVELLIEYAVVGPPATNCPGSFKVVVAEYNSVNDPTKGGGNSEAPIIAPAPINPPIHIKDCLTYEGFEVETVAPFPGNCFIDEATFVAKATIFDVPPLDEDKYYYCLRTDPQDCDEDDLKPLEGETINYDKNSQTVTFNRLCGDGDKKLKTDCAEDGSDWFHSGKTYRVSLFNKDKEGAYAGYDAAFYIIHYYPQIIEPKPGERPALNIKKIQETKTGYNLTVKLKGRNLKGGNNDKYNDYFLRVDGHDNEYRSKSACLFISTQEGAGEANVFMPLEFTDSDGNVRGQLTEGLYFLKIFDGRDASDNHASCKENDFVYYYIPIKIGGGTSPGVISPAIIDPKNKELSAGRIKPVAVPICSELDRNQYGYCTKIPTALGIKINTEPALFIRDVFTIVLSIGGIASTIFFIQAGYVLMTSAGNKEKVAASREQITAAIMGLVFIILSITILEFIGINILRLPGFSN